MILYKKITAYILTIAFLFSEIPIVITVKAEESSIIKEGMLTDTFSYQLTEDGTLTVFGSGNMPSHWDMVQYREEHIKDEVETIIDDQGHSSVVGDYDEYDIHDQTEIDEIKNLIRQIVIADGITSISNEVLASCTNCTTIIMSDSVEHLEEYCFEHCHSLQSVEFSKGLKRVDYCPFAYCTNLKEVTLKMERIPQYMFWEFGELEKVYMEDTVQYVEDCAFRECTKLREVHFSKNIKEMGSNVFQDSKLLKRLYLPMEKVPDGLLEKENDEIDGTKDFYAETIILEDSVEEIGNCAFVDCTSIKEVVMSPNIRIVGDAAFKGCTSLTELVLPNLITEVGESALEGCTSLVEIELPGNLTVLGNSAFRDCKSLIEIELPDLIRTIGERTFEGCTALESVRLSPELTVIEQYAFEGCISLKEIDIPKHVERIGDYSFANCRSLREFEFPRKIFMWNNHILDNDASLTKAVIYEDSMIWLDCLFKCDNISTLYVYGYGNIGSSNCDSITDSLTMIYGYASSPIEEFARDNDIPFTPIDVIEEDEYYSSKYTKMFSEEKADIKVSAWREKYYNSLEADGVVYTDYANIDINEALAAQTHNSMMSSVLFDIRKCMFDGNIETYYYEDLVHGSYITVDLKEEYIINQLTIWWRDKTQIDGYNVQLSLDGVSYEQMVPIMCDWAPFGFRTDKIHYLQNQRARYIKVTLEDRQSHGKGVMQIDELAVYAVKPKIEIVTTETVTTEVPTIAETVTTEKITTEVPTTKEKITTEMITTKVQTTTEKIATEGPTTQEKKTEVMNNKNEKIKIKKISEINYHSAKISWNKLTSVKVYRLYRKSKKKGMYKKVADVSKESYIDKNVKAGKIYYYKVEALNNNGKTVLSEAKSVKIKGKPDRPKLIVGIKGKVWNVKWGTIPDNSVGIEVAMKSKESGFKKYKVIHTSMKIKKSKKEKGATGVQAAVDELKKGATYYFRARTFAIVNKKKVYSSWSKVKKMTRK